MRRKKRKPNKFKENQKNNKEANRAVEVNEKPPDQKLQNQKIKQTKRQSRRRKEKNGLTIKDVNRLYWIDSILKVQHHSEFQSD